MALPLVNISWRINGTLRPLFASLDAAGRVRMLQRIGGAVRHEVQGAARAKPWRKLGNEFAGKTSFQVHGSSSVEVGTSHALGRIRQEGGEITAPGKGPLAKGAPMLTIPVHDAAKGLFVGQLRKRGWTIFAIPRKPAPARFLLGYRGRSGGKRRKGQPAPRAELLYVLKKSVYHPADPWFPTDEAVFRAVRSAIAFAGGGPG